MNLVHVVVLWFAMLWQLCHCNEVEDLHKIWRDGNMSKIIESKYQFIMTDENTTSWDLYWMKGIFKGQTLRMHKVINPHNDWHSCYLVKCIGPRCPTSVKDAYLDFCYPALLITGLPKCGTSAMYSLLSRYEGAILMDEKENCPHARRRPHWQLFNSMPRMKDVTEEKLVIDGCINVEMNMKLRQYLRQPKTIYIVLTRNYADMLWSSYNFWCHWYYDGTSCGPEKWTIPGTHIRSPEIFHDIIQGDINKTKVDSPFYKENLRPCAVAGGYYSEFLELKLWPTVPRMNTLVFASEELETHPENVVQKVIGKMGISGKYQFDIQNFTKVRFNAQENRGMKRELPIEQYQPGLFAASHFKPMLPQTRALLDKCWHMDCLLTSQLTGYLYPACINDSLNLQKQGKWKTWDAMLHDHNDTALSPHTEQQSNDAIAAAVEAKYQMIPIDHNKTLYWDLHWMKGIFKGQTLRMHKVVNPHNNDWHSCYLVKCIGPRCPATVLESYLDFCYPAVVITGLPKCGTSAMYSLLSRYTGVVLMDEKENCPHARRRPHWQLFNSMPRMKEVTEGKLVIDGCLNVDMNLMLRSYLKQPNTLYIVMTRNYADMLWSSYNFFCHWYYDGTSCGPEKWTIPGTHIRSPEIFHDIIQGDINGTKVDSPFYKETAKPCEYAGVYFSEFLWRKLWPAVPRNKTMVIASEEMERNPWPIVEQIQKHFQMNPKTDKYSFQLQNFTKYRYNAQESRGMKETSTQQFRGGVYNVSHYRPMLETTRVLLDRCWSPDCVVTSQLTGHQYPACAPQIKVLMDTGKWTTGHSAIP